MGVVVGVIFGIVLLVSLAIMAGGTYMVKRWLGQEKNEEEAVNTKLTTKMSICRKTHPGPQSECIYEDQSHYRDCSACVHCIRQTWVWQQFISGRFDIDYGLVVKEEKDTLAIANTEFTDLRRGQVVSKGKMRAGEGRMVATGQGAISEFSAEDSWEPRTPNTLRCVKIEKNATENMTNLINWYSKCNDTLCDKRDNYREFAIRVELLDCNLAPPNPVTGMRSQLCSGKPIKVIACKRCQGGTGTVPHGGNENCTGFMERLNFDGTTCSTSSVKSGLCVMGTCYEYEKDIV